MGIIRENHRFLALILCALSVSMIFFGHLYATPLVVLGILLMAALLLLTDESLLMGAVLFFIPWLMIVKFSFGQTAWFTYILPFVVLILIFRRVLFQRGVPAAPTICVVLLALYLLVVRVIRDTALFENNLIKIVLMLMLVVLIAQSEEARKSFRTSCLFFGLSTFLVSLYMSFYTDNTVLAAFAAQDSATTGLRFSGLSNDPNFYSSLMLMAITCLLVIVCMEKKTSVRLFALAVAIGEFYFGAMSGSKMFMLGVIFAAAMALLYLMMQRYPLSYKVGLVLIIGALAIVFFASGLFDEQLDVFTQRMETVSDATSLTTSRNELFQRDLTFFSGHPRELVFGVGFYMEQDILKPHNMPLQVVIQIGLVGTALLVGIFVGVARQFSPLRLRNPTEIILALMMLGVLGLLWLALPFMQLYEFFVYPLLMLQAMYYISHVEQAVPALARWRSSALGKLGEPVRVTR